MRHEECQEVLGARLIENRRAVGENCAAIFDRRGEIGAVVAGVARAGELNPLEAGLRHRLVYIWLSEGDIGLTQERVFAPRAEIGGARIAHQQFVCAGFPSQQLHRLVVQLRVRPDGHEEIMMGWMIALALTVIADLNVDIAFAARMTGSEYSRSRIYLSKSGRAPVAISKTHNFILDVGWLTRDRITFLTDDFRIFLIDLETGREKEIGELPPSLHGREFPPKPPTSPYFVDHLNITRRLQQGTGVEFESKDLVPGAAVPFGDSHLHSYESGGLKWVVGNRTRKFSDDWFYSVVFQQRGSDEQFILGQHYLTSTGIQWRIVALNTLAFSASELIPATVSYDWWPFSRTAAWITPRQIEARRWRSYVKVRADGQIHTVPGTYDATGVAIRP